MRARMLFLLVPFVILGCVSTPSEQDVDLRFVDTRERAKEPTPPPNPALIAFRRLDFGMSYEQVRSIMGREPSRNEVKDKEGRSCSWSLGGGEYANVRFDAKNRVIDIKHEPAL